ncbi:hypothetical protein IJ750_05830 [bacterium]|nr:hypothetical protein [bacterium]
MNIIKKLSFALIAFYIGLCTAYAEEASVIFNINVPSFTRITPVTSPVLIANITDKTGNLHSPLVSKFKVITNSSDQTQLYLSANVVTDAGYENAMYEQGGRVYIAFAHLAGIPSSSALHNCKMGAIADASPGIVSYPITSIQGAEHKFLPSKQKYEVVVNNGTSYVTVNVGSNVNRMSFAPNDPRGFYQAVLSLTEADI